MPEFDAVVPERDGVMHDYAGNEVPKVQEGQVRSSQGIDSLMYD